MRHRAHLGYYGELRNPVRGTKSPARNRMASLLTGSVNINDTGEMDTKGYTTCSLLRLTHWAIHKITQDMLGQQAKFCAFVQLSQMIISGATWAMSHPKELGRDHYA